MTQKPNTTPKVDIKYNPKNASTKIKDRSPTRGPGYSKNNHLN